MQPNAYAFLILQIRPNPMYISQNSKNYIGSVWLKLISESICLHIV